MTNTPNYYLNLGAQEYLSGNYAKAKKGFKQGLALFPNEPSLLNNLAATYVELGENKKASELYYKSVSIEPNNAIFHNNLGVSLKNIGKIRLARQNFERSAILDPALTDPIYNQGNLFRESGNYEKATEFYLKSIELDAKNPKAWLNLGITYRQVGNLPSALDAFNNALQADARCVDAYTNLAITYQDLCLWSKLEGITEKVRSLDKARATDQRTIEDPFFSITTDNRPKNNLLIAKSWSKHLEVDRNHMVKRLPSGSSGLPIKIGLVGDGFRDFPTGHNIISLLEKINKNRFEVHTYSYGIDDESIWRKRTKEATIFTDITGLTDKQAAERIAADKIDILIDLKGFILGSRLKIFAYRPSDIQISWLGYPGTTGAKFIDYAIVDRVVLPKKNEKYWSERLLFMPNSYRPVDTTIKPSIKISNKNEDTVVFASFNNLYKIEPKVWHAWIEILRKVENSELWLWKSNKYAPKELIKKLKISQIDHKRVKFKKRLDKKAHLNRLKSVDIALDTFITNGHTTTVDCLWAGVPVVTLQGKHFNSRVSASCLINIGMPELVANNVNEYIKLSVKLATNANLLAKTTKRIKDNKNTYPLFDMDRFTTDFENLLEKLWKSHQQKN